VQNQFGEFTSIRHGQPFRRALQQRLELGVGALPDPRKDGRERHRTQLEEQSFELLSARKRGRLVHGLEQLRQRIPMTPPVPDEPKRTGLLRAWAMSSCTLFAGTDGWTANTNGSDPTKTTGAKSLPMLKGSVL